MIFNERNDPNQISNLIDYQTGESKLNYSTLKSDISENDSKVYDNSFDKPHYRSIDSQISEYAVQKSVMEYNDFKSRSEYESGNSVLNNLQFTSKNNKGEEYPSNKKDGYINYLWRRGNENNRESQKTIDNSKKDLLNDLNQFNENNTNNNKINLSNMLTDNSAIKKHNNNNTNNTNITSKTDRDRDMMNRDSVDSGNISYICSNNNTNINESNLDVGVTAEEIERFNKNKYKLNTNSNISKFNVDSNNLNSDVNTNQSGINNFSNNDKRITKNASSTDDISGIF